MDSVTEVGKARWRPFSMKGVDLDDRIVDRNERRPPVSASEAGGAHVFGVPPPRCRGGQTATVLAEQPEKTGADREVQAVVPPARSRPERGQRRGVGPPGDPPGPGGG